MICGKCVPEHSIVETEDPVGHMLVGLVDSCYNFAADYSDHNVSLAKPIRPKGYDEELTDNKVGCSHIELEVDSLR